MWQGSPIRRFASVGPGFGGEASRGIAAALPGYSVIDKWV